MSHYSRYLILPLIQSSMMIGCWMSRCALSSAPPHHHPSDFESVFFNPHPWFLLSLFCQKLPNFETLGQLPPPPPVSFLLWASKRWRAPFLIMIIFKIEIWTYIRRMGWSHSTHSLFSIALTALNLCHLCLSHSYQTLLVLLPPLMSNESLQTLKTFQNSMSLVFISLFARFIILWHLCLPLSDLFGIYILYMMMLPKILKMWMRLTTLTTFEMSKQGAMYYVFSSITQSKCSV